MMDFDPSPFEGPYYTDDDSSVTRSVTNRIQEAESYSIHLSNVISGINHEVSPWIGGALNILSRLVNISNQCDKDSKSSLCDNIRRKIKSAVSSLEQSVIILSTLSGNVKMLKEHSICNTSLRGTIESWIKVALLDIYIKEMIGIDNIHISYDSLEFESRHSPMYLAQIIFNLAKNTVDHNKDILDNIQINIYGNRKTKTLIYEDNGHGIPDHILKSMFTVGNTTKKDKNQHGLGLSACMDYCVLMNAIIICESIPGLTRFIIQFDSSYERIKSDEHIDIKRNYRSKKIQLEKCKNVDGHRSDIYEAYNGNLSDVSEKNT
jgi:signal transduction histidine kinase